MPDPIIGGLTGGGLVGGTIYSSNEAADAQEKAAAKQAEGIEKAALISKEAAEKARIDVLGLFDPAFKDISTGLNQAREDILAGRQSAQNVLNQSFMNASNTLQTSGQQAMNAILGRGTGAPIPQEQPAQQPQQPVEQPQQQPVIDPQLPEQINQGIADEIQQESQNYQPYPNVDLGNTQPDNGGMDIANMGMFGDYMRDVPNQGGMFDAGSPLGSIQNNNFIANSGFNPQQTGLRGNAQQPANMPVVNDYMRQPVQQNFNAYQGAQPVSGLRGGFQFNPRLVR